MTQNQKSKNQPPWLKTHFKMTLSKIIEIGNRIPPRVLQISLRIFLGIALLISLMPIIAWYAGIIGVGFFIYQWIHISKTQKNSPESKITLLKEMLRIPHNRTAFYIVLFGILIHGSCRIHSQLLINGLYNQALHEKNIIISNLEKK